MITIRAATSRMSKLGEIVRLAEGSSPSQVAKSRVGKKMQEEEVSPDRRSRPTDWEKRRGVTSKRAGQRAGRESAIPLSSPPCTEGQGPRRLFITPLSSSSRPSRSPYRWCHGFPLIPEASLRTP